MTEVTLKYKDDYIQSFSVEGHTSFQPEGRDIYCAGVSAVVQTALLGLIKHLSEEPAYELEKGCLKCELPACLSEEDREKAQIILSTMEQGLLSMQQAYTGYMKVTVRRS